MIREIHGDSLNQRIVDEAVEILRAGGIIIYPTDTVYGLGCDINQKSAIEKIYRIKAMEHSKPLSFICADLKDIAQYAKVSTIVYREMKRHLPGPYTFILPAMHAVPKMVVSKQKTVGIRIPDHELSLAIVRQLGNPIVTTSLDISERTFASDPMDFMEFYEDRVDLIIHAGPSYHDPSTIIDFTTDQPRLLRAGQGDISWITTV